MLIRSIKNMQRMEGWSARAVVFRVVVSVIWWLAFVPCFFLLIYPRIPAKDQGYNVRRYLFPVHNVCFLTWSWNSYFHLGADVYILGIVYRKSFPWLPVAHSKKRWLEGINMDGRSSSENIRIIIIESRNSIFLASMTKHTHITNLPQAPFNGGKG
jgi:hypothetical protein